MKKMIRTFAEGDEHDAAALGGKGSSLVRLVQAGYPVPDGFIILPSAFSAEQLEPAAWAQTREYLNRLREKNEEITFAVRSSALSEDSIQASFAGEFETVLNVRDDDDIYQAIQTVYHSRLGERVQAYSRAQGISADHEVAVIIQQLVRAEVSGVMFTANPVSGRRDQAMITATWGLGEALVSGLVTPDTLILDKENGQVLSREIGTKQLMTVLLAKKTEERPVPEAQRGTPALTDNQAAELVLLGNRVEALYGRPMDIEWALAEGVVAILQARPITALPNPPDTGWQLPPGSYMAIRNNIVELMADPLTPLFSTIGLTAVNTSLIRLLSNFFGRSDLMPPNVIINVNGYAYYNGSWSFSQLARILLRSGGIMKRMFSGAVERWTIEGRPQYVAAVEAWQREDWRELSAADLLQAVRVLSEAAVDAYGSLVSGVIPAAWISEGIFTFIYDKLIKRREDPPAPTFLMGYDSVPIMVEKVLYDLAAWINSHSQLALYFSHTTAGELAVQFLKDEPPRAVDPEEWRAWRVLFQAHLDQYGHTIYNLDFANPVPADDPAVLLDTIKLFLSGQGVNPYMRQEAAIHRRQEAVDSMLGRLKRLRLKLFRKTIAPAQRYAPLRENGLADVGLGYPLLRQVFRELGSRFAAGGMINTPDDIYWLIEEEVHDGAVRLDNGEILENRSAAVVQRKADWRAARRMTPPVALPQRKILGIDMQKIKAARAKKGAGDMLKGVAAGAGSVTAVACVVHGPEDFGRMKTGDVLVAAITTPAWTPLFARAAAVVTDVGGPLSHGSIVAREYGIPAVLGTGEATKRIRSGQRIRVNGDTGVVEILRQDQDALVLARPLLGV